VKNCTVKAKEMNAGDRAVAGLHSEGGGGVGEEEGERMKLEGSGDVGTCVHNNTIIKFSVGFYTCKRDGSRPML